MSNRTDERTEKRNQELRNFGQEMQQRKDALIDEYKKTHKIPSRGIIDTPEIRALREECKNRFIEICEKYKE